MMNSISGLETLDKIIKNFNFFEDFLKISREGYAKYGTHNNDAIDNKDNSAESVTIKKESSVSKSKINMPSELKEKCSVAIHSASVATTAAGAIPIPLADTIPISATQAAMIIRLGKIFDLTISDSVAKAIASIAVAQAVGRAIVKSIPIAGPVICAITAGTLTETLGWLVADDFYRISCGERAENISEALQAAINFGKENL